MRADRSNYDVSASFSWVPKSDGEFYPIPYFALVGALICGMRTPGGALRGYPDFEILSETQVFLFDHLRGDYLTFFCDHGKSDDFWGLAT
jgi:hypothetical protein